MAADACYCDTGDRPDLSRAVLRTARKQHRCYECGGPILPGDKYENWVCFYDGSWDRAKVCPGCLDLRQYVQAHAPCFCWLYGSMLEDAEGVVAEHGHVSAGFFIGAKKRLLRIERRAQAFFEQKYHKGNP